MNFRGALVEYPGLMWVRREERLEARDGTVHCRNARLSSLVSPQLLLFLPFVPLQLPKLTVRPPTIVASILLSLTVLSLIDVAC